MHLAHPSETPRRLVRRRGGGAWRVLLLPLFAGSCFFKLPDPIEDSVDGGITSGGSGPNVGGTSAGRAGGNLGGMNAGGAAGATVDPTCPSDKKLCDGDSQCHDQTPDNGCGSTTCTPCNKLNGAVVGCVEGQCAVIGCAPGFADCDGDALAQVGELGGNGCEYSLGTVQSSDATLSVPHRQIIVDGSRDDWAGIPAYGFEELCQNCKSDDNTPPISAGATIPPRTDLDASFRVAWDENNFYVFVEAFDNHLFDAGAPGNHCQIGAACEDGVQVFFDGLNNRTTQTGGYGSDDHRVFLGLSDKFEAPAQGQPQIGDVAIKTQRQGQFCYRLEAQFNWHYIVFGASQGSQQAANQFPPAASQSYGFDIAIEDWDPSISDPNVVDRQSQVFWSDPGINYANSPAGIVGSMTLAPASDAGLQ
jgi:hypothetical protein